MEPREKALQQQVAITKSELFKKFKNSKIQKLTFITFSGNL
jgi:hypothetical protein